MVMGVGKRLRLRLRLFRFSALQHGGKCSESLAACKHFSRSAAAAAVDWCKRCRPAAAAINQNLISNSDVNSKRQRRS